MFKYNKILHPILKPKMINGKIIKEKTMVEIDKGVYIGNCSDYEFNKDKQDMNFINACKYPYWKEYVGNHCNNGLYAYENNRLICNLVDADDVNYIPKEIINECVGFIEKSVSAGKNILINCNEGRSRSATIGLIYLIKNNKINGDNFAEVMEKYKEIVPRFEPNLGMLSYASNYFNNLKLQQKK
jgi:protein-tyrosine phosphatase